MNEKINSFLSLLESDEVKEIICIGEKIKKLDKSNDKRTIAIILLSVISMTFLGLLALGKTGSLIFFSVTAISSFWLYYSSKKNILIKYLTFYRSRVPKIIAMAEGCEVIAEDIPDSNLIASLGEGKPTYRMCHRYADLYIGFLKFIKNSESTLEGIVFLTQTNGADFSLFEERLREEVSDFTLKEENGMAVLFISGFDDYLGGRIETKDDLSKESLLRQYKYYLLGDAFKKAVNGEQFEINLD